MLNRIIEFLKWNEKDEKIEKETKKKWNRTLKRKKLFLSKIFINKPISWPENGSIFIIIEIILKFQSTYFEANWKFIYMKNFADCGSIHI
jgi:hypothetical protein